MRTKSKVTIADVTEAYGPNSMSIIRNLGLIKPRFLYQFSTFCADQKYRTHLKDVNTSARGIYERIFFVKNPDVPLGFAPPPGPEPDAFQALIVYRAQLLRHLRRKAGNLRWPLDRQQFVDRYKGKKRTIYQNALDSLLTEPLHKRDARIKYFVKIEKLDLGSKPDPAPRCIQPRDPRYNLEVGRFLQDIEHLLFKSINAVFGKTVVAKGLNAAERGHQIGLKWSRFRRPVCIMLDASRFDQHVSIAALLFEHSIYNRFWKNTKLAKWLRWQLRTMGFALCDDGFIRYMVDGRRCSGDVNTGMGNIILMCGIVHAYLHELGVVAEFFDDGDDFIIICEQEDLHLFDGFAEFFLRFGFEMERDPDAYQIEHIVFCQCSPVLVDGDYRMVRDPSKVVTKDQYSTNMLPTRASYEYYRRAVSECGLAMAGDLPIYWRFYELMNSGVADARYSKKNADGPRDTYSQMVHLSDRMSVKLKEPSDETRASFAVAFGVSPDDQREIELMITNNKMTWGAIELIDEQLNVPGLDIRRSG